MSAVACGPPPQGVIAHQPSGSPTEARAASDAEPGMGSRWGRGAQSGQHRPSPGGVTSCPVSSDSEKLPATGDLSQHVVHPGLSREGVAADGGGGGQIPEGPAGGGGPLDDSGRTGEAGERDPHVNHKGSRGAPCLGPCSAVPFGAPRAYVMSLRGPSLWAESHTPVLPRAAYPKGPLIRTYLFSPACSPPSTRSHTHIWMLTCTCRHAHSHTCTHSYSHSYIHTCTHSRYTHIRPEHSSMRTRSVSRNRKGNKRTQEKKRKSRDRKSQDSPGNNRQAGKGGRQRENVEGITQLRVFLL